MSRRLWIVLVSCLIALSSPVRGQTDPLTTDLSTLRSAGVDTDGPGLLRWFKKRTVAEGTRAKVTALIRQLGGEDFDTRVKAQNDLVEMGAIARAQLTQALRDSDAEIRRRARWALEKIGPASSESALLPAAARVLAARKPAGAVEALLDFLPGVEEPEVAEEVARALGGVAMSKAGKPEKAVLLALSDKYPIKRYAAAHALIRSAGAAQRPAVRKLLEDADIGVRRRVAVALLEAKDRSALPVLVDLLGAANSDDASAAEEALSLVAGDKAPTPPDSDTPVARERYRQAWQTWYKEAGAKLDLAKVDLSDVGRGFTLIALLDRTGTTGRVQEWDKTGRVRWTISNLRYPIHISKSRRDRVLVCEYYGNRVTERDTKGNILWSKTLSYQPIAAHRLRNGHTFIAARNMLMELDKSGRELKTLTRPTYDIVAAERHADGTFSIITSSQQYQKLDSAGRVLKSFNVGYVSGIGIKVHFLPTGGVIVPDYSRRKVREYDADGKLVKEIDAQYPNIVQRLPDGKLMIGSRLNNRVWTVDKDGKEIASQITDGRPMFLERR